MCRYVPLQILRLGAAISHVIVFYFIAADLDLDNIKGSQYGLLIFVGVINLLGRCAPYYTKLYIDELKESLQAEQATSIIAKIFDLPHSNVIATPTGEMVQLISKVFRNLDTLLPAIYGAIIPVAVEVVVAFIFITVAYGWLGCVQLFLFVLYSWISYTAAGKKAERNKDLLNIMLSE